LGEGGINMVSAPLVAKERGINVAETRRGPQGAFGSYVRLVVTTERQTRTIAATVFSDGKPRFIQIKGVDIECEPLTHMLYTTNEDTPGYVGALGMKLGALGINIATFAMGRNAPGGEAIALIGVDEPVTPQMLADIKTLRQVRDAKALSF
jgi:D-3-phosphoglycerate dehydrogenase